MILAVSTCNCGACTTSTTGTSTTFQMYCNCEISMVRAINLHSFLHCLNHRASVVDNSGHVNNLSSGHVATGISTVVSTTCTRNWGNTSKTRPAPVGPARHTQPRRRPLCQGAATVEPQWSSEQPGPWGSASAYRQGVSTTVMNCNSGKAKQCTALSGP